MFFFKKDYLKDNIIKLMFSVINGDVYSILHLYYSSKDKIKFGKDVLLAKYLASKLSPLVYQVAKVSSNKYNGMCVVLKVREYHDSWAYKFLLVNVNDKSIVKFIKSNKHILYCKGNVALCKEKYREYYNDTETLLPLNKVDLKIMKFIFDYVQKYNKQIEEFNKNTKIRNILNGD